MVLVVKNRPISQNCEVKCPDENVLLVPVRLEYAGEWSAGHCPRKDMRQFGGGGNVVIQFILDMRHFALASLRDGGEEVEGSIGYDIWDLGSMNYAGNVQVERAL
jgi:hypothetical protein